MNSEPVYDSDATRIASGSARRGVAGAEERLRASAAVVDASIGELAAINGLNPVVSAAGVLLAAMARIRASVSYPNPAALRAILLRQFAQFETDARARGVTPEAVGIARYALATMVDESVAGTPWGGTADWARQSILVTLYKETWGGEKFYQLLNRMAADPAPNIDLLELLYVCLCLGFEGRFKVIDNGRAQLESVRERLAQIIRKTRGEHERDLSAQWRGEATTIGKNNSFLALWSAAAVCAVLVLGVYLWLCFALNDLSDAVAFGKIQVQKPLRAVALGGAAPAPPRLRKFLEAEIRQGLVEVSDGPRESRVLLRGNDLFESGSATIEPAFEATLARIGAALNEVDGSVTISGHSDDRPMRSARFPSNWKLSQERAASVLRQMASVVKVPARMTAEGRADQEPLQPNDSEVHRARNRRVEIILRVPGA